MESQHGGTRMARLALVYEDADKCVYQRTISEHEIHVHTEHADGRIAIEQRVYNQHVEDWISSVIAIKNSARRIYDAGSTDSSNTVVSIQDPTAPLSLGAA